MTLFVFAAVVFTAAVASGRYGWASLIAVAALGVWVGVSALRWLWRVEQRRHSAIERRLK